MVRHLLHLNIFEESSQYASALLFLQNLFPLLLDPVTTNGTNFKYFPHIFMSFLRPVYGNISFLFAPRVSLFLEKSNFLDKTSGAVNDEQPSYPFATLLNLQYRFSFNWTLFTASLYMPQRV